MPKLKHERGPWAYEETVACWTVWSIGYGFLKGFSWEPDMLYLHFGPFVFIFKRSPLYA